jgi:hypothetical protein
MRVIYFGLRRSCMVPLGCIGRRGHLDRFKMSESRFKQWEDTILANFARREGWVVGHAATGSDAWNNTSVRFDTIFLGVYETREPNF